MEHQILTHLILHAELQVIDINVSGKKKNNAFNLKNIRDWRIIIMTLGYTYIGQKSINCKGKIDKLYYIKIIRAFHQKKTSKMKRQSVFVIHRSNEGLIYTIYK